VFFYDLTLDSAAENLALDEALVEVAEAAAEPHETLRLWESRAPLVVVGRSSRVHAEVNVAVCRERGVPILRRPSGGAAVVAGPGCLMYAVVLDCRLRPELRSIENAHRFVLETNLRAVRSLGIDAARKGTSDLAIDDRKFSGNSLRCRRNSLLYHGTLLFQFDLPLVGELLKMPDRQPAYRAGRTHDEFVANLSVIGDDLRAALARAWSANLPAPVWPRERVSELVRSRYSRDAWNLQH
jgi:lipoate-protein ligase A